MRSANPDDAGEPHTLYEAKLSKLSQVQASAYSQPVSVVGFGIQQSLGE